jgi:hypothetical protein
VTAKHTAAAEIAARLWPPPDPVNYCRREAIAHLERSDEALRGAVRLRTSADPIIWSGLVRLHIHETEAERVLGLYRGKLRHAEREITEALDFLAAARSENELRFYDEHIREREEKRAARA